MFKYSNSFSSFSVDDLQKAKQFYSQVLELDLSELPVGVLQIDFKGGNRVMIYPKDNHEPATYTVLNFEVEDAEKAVDALIEAGVKFEQYSGEMQTDEKGISRSEYAVMAWFKDPAGNILSIIETN